MEGDLTLSDVMRAAQAPQPNPQAAGLEPLPIARSSPHKPEKAAQLKGHDASSASDPGGPIPLTMKPQVVTPERVKPALRLNNVTPIFREIDEAETSLFDEDAPEVPGETEARVTIPESPGERSQTPITDDAEDLVVVAVDPDQDASVDRIASPPSFFTRLCRTRPEDRSSAWTIPLICAGLAMIACCLLIPAADDNRRLVHQREQLKLDLQHIEQQIAVNAEFLQRVNNDPNLLERLAQRQLRMVREGTSALELAESGRASEMSPFLLVTVPPPPRLEAYRPVGGRFAELCRTPRSRLLLIGAGLLLLASGLVLSSNSPEPQTRRSPEPVKPKELPEDDS